jgi:hypothetical protein
MGLHRRPYISILSPSDNVHELAPLEIADKDLTQDIEIVDDWHGDQISYIPGLNHLTRLFMLWYENQQVGHEDLSLLQGCLQQVHSALDYLPPTLRWRGGLSRSPQSSFGTDVQTVNIYITQLHIRLYLLDQIDHLQKKRGATATSPEITNERQRIVDDMLAILYQMPEDTLEANGVSLMPKIRDIGLTLLNDDANPNVALVNLDRLLAKLEVLDFYPQTRLEQISPASTQRNGAFSLRNDLIV